MGEESVVNVLASAEEIWWGDAKELPLILQLQTQIHFTDKN